MAKRSHRPHSSMSRARRRPSGPSPVLRCSQRSASPRFPPETSTGPKISAVRAYADAHVSVSAQNANYGKQRGLTVDARPMTRAYLRFGIDLEKGTSCASTCFYSRTRSQLGYQVRLATESWRERRITFENAPRVSPRYVSSGACVPAPGRPSTSPPWSGRTTTRSISR